MVKLYLAKTDVMVKLPGKNRDVLVKLYLAKTEM